MRRTTRFCTFRFFVIFGAIFLVLSACREQPPPVDAGTTVIAAIGDSLTWGALAFGLKAESGGYPAMLETMLRNEGYDVVVFNKGIPGEKAYQTRARFARAIADADIALLMIGVNDIIRPESCPQPNHCRTNEQIEAIIAQAVERGVPLLVSTLTPAQINCSREWANEPIQAINDQIRVSAQQHNIPLVDNHQAIATHGGALFSDCLHLTNEGYRVLAESWYRALLDAKLLRQ